MIYDAIIIGTGCGGYSTADWLHSKGITNIAIITENRWSGTSRNAGSDKQTYYKLGLDGANMDSAYNMANTIVAGGSSDGVMAYIDSVNSSKCFYRLVGLGVNFPHDKYGGYVGYKTDHDTANRGTSVGPYTSKLMTEKLENKVLNINKTQLIDNCSVVRIVVKDNECQGVIVLDKTTNECTYIASRFVIACTGAPACIYQQSVFPLSQHGMTGMLIEAGCSLNNFQEWQYGMASIKFRWNVSGSYMQVVPRFVSVDSKGIEYDFLNDYYQSFEELSQNIFLKGYEWPFNVDKSSSQIDILVNKEIQKGHRVYLDYTKNPKGFDTSKLNKQAKEYLSNSSALADTPIERLRQLNSKAIELYLDHDIDISCQYLEIAVCAQHNNGGVFVDDNWQTSVSNLFAVGEVAGTFGVTRPGGTALNSSQVGGLRAAEYIASNIDCDKPIDSELLQSELNLINQEISYIKAGDTDIKQYAMLMSKYGGIYRDKQKLKELINQLGAIKFKRIKAADRIDYFRQKDMLISTKALINTILLAMPHTGSRGSAYYIDKNETIPENTKYRDYLTILKENKIDFVKCREVPKTNYWFENIYNESKKEDNGGKQCEQLY